MIGFDIVEEMRISFVVKTPDMATFLQIGKTYRDYIKPGTVANYKL